MPNPHRGEYKAEIGGEERTMRFSLNKLANLQEKLGVKSINEVVSDLANLGFDPDDFLPTERRTIESDTGRLGLHHVFTPRSEIIASFIYREHVYKSSSPEHEAEFIIAKGRNIRTGIISLYFDGKHQTFGNALKE